MKQALLLIPLLLLGCAKKYINPNTPKFIEKQGIHLANRMEATPIVWIDGRLLLIVGARELHKIEVYHGTTLVSSLNTTIGLTSAIVVNGTLYVYGSVDWAMSSSNTLQMVTTTDLLTWSAPVTVLPAIADRVYYNSSVAPTSNGNYIMAVETCEPNTICFNARFFTSSDLVTWTEVGELFMPESYAACPTIRYVDGTYYMFYLASHHGIFTTEVVRSSNLTNWQRGNYTVLSPTDTPDEGNNSSDMDFVEYQGQLFINYADGDQLTWSNIRTAVYRGTFKSFAERFF